MAFNETKKIKSESEGTSTANKTIIFLLTACIVLLLISIFKNEGQESSIPSLSNPSTLDSMSMKANEEVDSAYSVLNEAEMENSSQTAATVLENENLLGYIPVTVGDTKYQLEVYKNSDSVSLAAHYCAQLGMEGDKDCVVGIGSEIAKMNGIPFSTESLEPAQESQQPQEEERKSLFVEAALFVNGNEFKATFDANGDVKDAAIQFCSSPDVGLVEKGEQMVVSCSQQVYPLFRTYALAALSDVSVTIPVSLSDNHPAHEVSFKIGYDLVKVAENFCGEHWEEVASISNMGEEDCVKQVKGALWESTKKAMDQYHTSLIEASAEVSKTEV
jgi:hypothetical protein